MNSQEMTMPNPPSGEAGRVVEFELRRPRKEDLALPKVNVEPLRRAAEDLVLTGIGLSVLAGRAVAQTLQAAHRAGEEAAERPGPVTRALLRLVAKPQPTREPLSRSIPVLPISGYASLEADEVVQRLQGLSREQLAVVREYEQAHQGRAQVLAAIADLLSAMA